MKKLPFVPHFHFPARLMRGGAIAFCLMCSLLLLPGRGAGRATMSVDDREKASTSMLWAYSVPAAAFVENELLLPPGGEMELCIKLSSASLSPSIVKISIGANSMPHFPGFTEDTLVFQPGQTERCLRIPVSFVYQSNTYQFTLSELSNVSCTYGNEVKVGVEKELWTAPFAEPLHCTQGIMNFEGYTNLGLNTYFSQITLPGGLPMAECDPLPLIHNNGPGNTPGIMTEAGSNPPNTVAYMAGNLRSFPLGRSNPESIIVPLCNPLLPGCDYTIRLRYRRVFETTPEKGFMQIYGANMYPCDIPFPADCAAPPVIGGYQCIEPGVEVGTPVWQQYELVVNQASLIEPIRFLVIANNTLGYGPPPAEGHAGTDIYVDDIEVIRDCPPIVCPCENNPSGAGVNINTIDYGGTVALSQLIAENVLPPAGAANTCIAVSGQLVVDINYSLTDCRLKMQPGAEILVTQNAQLWLQGCEAAGCFRMWRGFRVQPGGALGINGSRVADAQYAVYLHPSQSFGTSPPNALMYNVNFDNNFTGIFTPDANTSGTVNAFVFSNRFTQSASTLLTPYENQFNIIENLPEQNQKSLAGIIVNRLGAFNSLNNSFEGLSSGIVARHATLSSNGDRFTRIESNHSYYPGWPRRGHAVSSVSNGTQLLRVERGLFELCPVGIASESSPLLARQNLMKHVQLGIEAALNHTGSIEIVQNNIEEALRGIQVFQANHPAAVTITDNNISTNTQEAVAGIVLVNNKAASLISDNSILVKQTGMGILSLAVQEATLHNNDIHLADATQARSGIHALITQKSFFVENTVTGSGLGGLNNVGLLVASSPGNLYCCNTLTNTRIGAYITGGSLSTQNFRGTNFSNHHTSLLLQNQNALLGSQTHKQNCWGPGAGPAVYGELTPVPVFVAQTYPFVVDPTINSCFMPAVHTPTGWFDIDNDIEYAGDICNLAPCDADWFTPESDDVKRLAIGDTTIAPAVLWELQRYLYARLQGQELQSPVIRDFVQQAESSSIGAFYRIGTELTALMQGDEWLNERLLMNMRSIQEHESLIHSADAQLSDELPTGEWRLMPERRHHLEEIHRLTLENVEIAKEQQAQRGERAEVLAEKNKTIAPETDFEANEQNVNDLYLHYIVGDFAPLQPERMEQLQSIARQCPFIGGNAVYRARAFWTVLTSEMPHYNDEAACANPPALLMPEQPMGTPSAVRDFTVFPNPAQNYINITLNTAEDVQSTLWVHDVFGRPLFEYALEAGSNAYMLNITDIPDGLYFFRVRFQGWDAIKKIIVAR